jgi:hypothetical protein
VEGGGCPVISYFVLKRCVNCVGYVVSNEKRQKEYGP